MKKDLEVLKVQAVPEHLDSRILTAARLAAYRNSRKNRRKKAILAFSAVAASFVAGFAVFVMPPAEKTTHFEVQYQALNDLSFIEQETFALAAELNCHSVYALDNNGTWENMP